MNADVSFSLVVLRPKGNYVTSLDFYYNHNVMNCHGGLGPLFLASGLTRMMNLPFVHLINQFLKDESPVGSPSMYPLHDAVGFFHMERWGL